MNLCHNCKKETNNPMFCSRSCAAITNNKLMPKRRSKNKCKFCNTPVQHKTLYCSGICKDLAVKQRKANRPAKQSATISHLKWRHKRKLKYIEYKGGKCENCGYDKCPAVLEFHHLDPSKKDFSITSHKSPKVWELVKPELDKCILFCANCHREEHFKIDNPTLPDELIP